MYTYTWVPGMAYWDMYGTIQTMPTLGTILHFINTSLHLLTLEYICLDM